MKCLVLLFILISGVEGALVWERAEVRLDIHPAQLADMATFPFVNTGKEPVVIEEVKVSCGCLSPHLQKRTFGPGESGELGIRLDLENRTGPFHKTVEVATSDGMRQELAVLADIPVLYKVAPVMMKFVAEGGRTPRTAKLVNPNKEPIPLLSATSSHEDISVELNMVREGFEYDVVVAPSSSAHNARSIIRIEVEPPPGKREAKQLKFYVHVE